jgi:hypothetical protein
MMALPIDREISSNNIRVAMSVVPAAAKGTTTRMFRSG